MSRRRRFRSLALGASLLLHGVILAAGVYLVTRPKPPAPGPVTLVGARRSIPPAAGLRPARRSPPQSVPRRAPAPELLPDPATPPEAPPPAGSSRVVLEPWADRSLAAWIRECRAGTAQPDSLLEPPLSDRERGLRNLAILSRRDFLGLRRQWMEEKFREVYAENFPLMR